MSSTRSKALWKIEKGKEEVTVRQIYKGIDKLCFKKILRNMVKPFGQLLQNHVDITHVALRARIL